MAGRGRGRGQGIHSNQGSSVPARTQPPPTYPPIQSNPVPLCTGDEYDYVLALRQEYRGAMKESPYFIHSFEKKRDIKRYSDKYQIGQQDNSNKWEPDWTLLPAELRKRKTIKTLKPNCSAKKKNTVVNIDIIKKLESLENQEQTTLTGDQPQDAGGEDGEKKKEEDEEEEVLEEEYQEEDLEEETDYNMDYFDNGEDFVADDDDDLDDEPSY